MTEFPSDFSPLVSQLLTLGDKNLLGTGAWLDYLEMGLTSEHIPELVTILQEINFFPFLKTNLKIFMISEEGIREN